MAVAAKATSDTGNITYEANGSVTMGEFDTTGGVVKVTATAGAITDGNDIIIDPDDPVLNTYNLNITAGVARSELHAGTNIGTLCDPIEIAHAGPLLLTGGGPGAIGAIFAVIDEFPGSIDPASSTSGFIFVRRPLETIYTVRGGGQMASLNSGRSLLNQEATIGVLLGDPRWTFTLQGTQVISGTYLEDESRIIDQQ